MKAPTMDEWAEKLGTKALNGFVYNGRTLREWIDLMASGKLVVIPDNATNGDVIMAIFPNASVYEHGSTYSVNNVYNFNSTWWNAPYKVGETDGKDSN